MSLVDQVMSRYEVAKSDKHRTDHLRYDAGKHAWPSERDMYRESESTSGELRTMEIFDSTAIDSSYRLASNIFAYLMPVGVKWFEYKARDYETSQRPDIAKWLSTASDVTHSDIWRSNFVREMFATIRSMVVFGTGVISLEKEKKDSRNKKGKKDKKDIVFRAYHISDIFLEENSKGNIDTVFRNIYYTARQAIQEYGEENLSKKIVDASKKDGDSTKFKFVNAVFPNTDYKEDIITSKKFVSLVIEVDGKHEVQKEGFDDNPYLVMRYSRIPGEVWGSCPTIELLPEIRMANQMRLTFIQGSELAVLPPMIAEDDGVIGQPVTEPGGMIYIRSGSAIPQPWKTGMNVGLNAEIIEQQRQLIRDGYFLNAFQTLEGLRNISSATESEIRKEEGLTLVSTVVGTVQKDVLDPLVLRVLSLVDKDELPPAPEDFEFDVEYQGRLAMAMSNVHAAAIEIWLGKWAPMQQFHDVLGNMDLDKAARASALAGAVPATLLKDVDERDAVRAKAQEQQDAAMTAQTAESASKALKNVSDPNVQQSLEGVL